MSILQRNCVRTFGRGPRVLMFAHGFGCDQTMWRFLTPAFEETFRVVLFDHVGSGRSDLSAYDFDRYASLQAYADDVLEIIGALALERVIFVGHSVSAIIGVLAAVRDATPFERLVLVGPSPRYLDDLDYVGGFTPPDVEQLLDALDSNYLGWSRTVAPQIMGNPDRPELGAELTNSFCRTDPNIAKQFARVTFLSDNRSDLPKVNTPSLVLQCSEDIIAPEPVGRYVARHLRDSELVLMRARGHCPHLSAPDETIAALGDYLQDGR